MNKISRLLGRILKHDNMGVEGSRCLNNQIKHDLVECLTLRKIDNFLVLWNINIKLMELIVIIDENMKSPPWAIIGTIKFNGGIDSVGFLMLTSRRKCNWSF